MRYDAEHKERTRALLLSEAARAIRAEGPQRISVAAIMARVGLTHGGFYAYFRSKDELVAQAVGSMFDDSDRRLSKVMADQPPSQALARYLQAYLSPAHRDNRARGCPIPALSADMPHLPPEARRAFAAGIERLNDMLATRLTELGDPRPRQSASSLLAEMSGAVALARSLGRTDASDAVLDASRTAIAERHGLPIG